jgi:hypothetical protein
MHNVWIYARRLVEGLALTIVGHGIILYLATIEIFPDRFVASMITAAVSAPAWAHWIMAGLFGLICTFFLEVFFWNRHSALPSFPAASPDVKVSTANIVAPPDTRHPLPESKTPLEIIFDLNNPGEQFWKKRQAKDKGGKLIPKMVLEYRIGVRNMSLKTIRNVCVSIETLGLIPIDPRDMVFQKGDKVSLDISPGYMELVPVWWVWPPEAGDAWGPTATAFHGPIRVTARGDDVYPAQAEFDYFSDQIPALVQITTK